MQVLSFNDIHPGCNQAVLILENGQEIGLENRGDSSRMIMGENWKVERKGQLSYEQKLQEQKLKHAWAHLVCSQRRRIFLEIRRWYNGVDE